MIFVLLPPFATKYGYYLSSLKRYGFRKPPYVELKARPKLGEREVTLVHVTDWIEKKLEQEFQVNLQCHLAFHTESKSSGWNRASALRAGQDPPPLRPLIPEKCTYDPTGVTFQVVSKTPETHPQHTVIFRGNPKGGVKERNDCLTPGGLARVKPAACWDVFGLCGAWN